MRILVTGVAGFIGYHLASHLVKLQHDVFGLDNLNPYYDVNLKNDRLRNLGVQPTGTQGVVQADHATSTLRFLAMDLTDRDRVMELFSGERFDVVCHLAAQAGVRYSLSNPDSYITNNVVGFLTILEAARHHSVSHLVYASSSSVYGLDRHIPFGETGAADHPISLYAASKRSNELMAHSYSHLFTVPTTGLRFFTVYGPWGRPDMALFVFTKAMLAGGSIDLYNYGDMQRDFTYIDDVVDGIVRVIDQPPQGVPSWDGRQSSISPAPARVYNIGRGSPVPLRELVSALEAELGTKARINEVPMQPGDVASTWADCTALREEYGFHPRTTIREGVHRFVAWYRDYYGI